MRLNKSRKAFEPSADTNDPLDEIDVESRTPDKPVEKIKGLNDKPIFKLNKI